MHFNIKTNHNHINIIIIVLYKKYYNSIINNNIKRHYYIINKYFETFIKGYNNIKLYKLKNKKYWNYYFNSIMFQYNKTIQKNKSDNYFNDFVKRIKPIKVNTDEFKIEDLVLNGKYNKYKNSYFKLHQRKINKYEIKEYFYNIINFNN